jgi:hypothetical protein
MFSQDPPAEIADIIPAWPREAAAADENYAAGDDGRSHRRPIIDVIPYRPIPEDDDWRALEEYLWNNIIR